MATQIGPKIGIEGEKEYRQQLRQIIDETKNLGAAMEKTASEWTANTSQMTKNRDVAQNLVKQIDLQKQKLSVMDEMLQKSTQQFGENSAATLNWQRAIDSSTASLNHMQQELDSLHGAEKLSEMTTQMADLGTRMQNIGANLAIVGGAMTASITAPLTAAGKASLELASSMEEASSKVDVIFGDMSESVKAFADTSLDSYGVSNVKAMEMIGTFGAMATQMGLSDRVAADMATTLTGLSGDLAAFHNSEVEVAQAALTGIFTGQTKALTQFAGAINEANLEEFAAKQGKVYNSMTEGEKVMTRYQLVLERTADAQGNFAMTGDGYAGSMQKFHGAIQELKVALGEQLLPIITPIVQAITKMVETFANLPAPVQKIIVVLLALAAAIGPIIVIIGTLLASFGSIITNAPMVAAAFGKIAAGVATLAASLGVTMPQLFLVIAIAAAVAVAIGALAAHWDEVSEAVSNAVNKIDSALDTWAAGNKMMQDNAKETLNAIVEYFKELPKRIADALKRAVQQIKDEFRNMVNSAKQSGKDFINGFVEGINQAISKVTNAVKKVADTVKDYLGFSCPDKGPLHDYETWMPDFMNGLAKGINSNKGVVVRAMNGLAKSMELPLDANASMNVALAGAGASSMGGMTGAIGGTTMNIYVDHISELNDLLRIQNQARQRMRMGAV